MEAAPFPGPNPGGRDGFDAVGNWRREIYGSGVSLIASRTRENTAAEDPGILKIVGLIPAYNAGKTITNVVDRVPPGELHHLIIVDDGSVDNTFTVLQELPRTIPIQILQHSCNRGYGAAQTTLYQAFLEDEDNDAAIMFHADGGNLPEELPLLLEPLRQGQAEVAVGSRTQGILQQAPSLLGSRLLGAIFKGPMPAYKFVFNRLLTAFQNFCHGTHYHAFHCGFRACTRKALMQVPFDQLGSWYLFDTEFLLAAHQAGLNIVEVPVGAFYDPQAGSSVPGWRYGLRIVRHSLAQLARRRFRSPGSSGSRSK